MATSNKDKFYNVRVTVEIIVFGEDCIPGESVEDAAKKFVEGKLRPQWSHVQKCEVVHETAKPERGS